MVGSPGGETLRPQKKVSPALVRPSIADESAMITRVRMKATVMPSIAPAALYLVGEFCETSAKISPGHFARSRGKAVRKLVIR